MSKFVVIDTETTWADAVMSIGAVIADSDTFKLIDKRYYVLVPFKNHGGMYTNALYLENVNPDIECSREEAIRDLKSFLKAHNVNSIFAYNASFDYRHLPELSSFRWYDIMKLAAYKQHNHKISHYAECHSTGRLKCGYGVENVYRMLSGNRAYNESHNAVVDAVDELEIMQMLEHELSRYEMMNRCALANSQLI